MLGWFEWDEVNQRLRVVIPPWDCVDAPRQPANVVKQRIDTTVQRIKALSLAPGHGSTFGRCFEHAATWLPDELLELGIETLLAATRPNGGLSLLVMATLDEVIKVPFDDLIRLGTPCEQERKNLFSAAMMMSSTTRPVYMNDLISRAREKLHDDHSTAEPHGSINRLLGRLESKLLIAPQGALAPSEGALIPADAAQVDGDIRRLLRRVVFSLGQADRTALVYRVDALERNERHTIVRHVAEEMGQFAGDVPLYAVCNALLNQIAKIAEVKSGLALPDSRTLARGVLDEAHAWVSACAAMTYRLTRAYLISLGNGQPTSPQLIQSHALLTAHTRSAAKQRLNQRQRWLDGPAPMAGALTVTADVGAQAADDPVHAWPVERLVRWINGPVTAKTAALALSDPEKLMTRDNNLLALDRERSNTPAPAKGQKDNLVISRAQAQEIVWQGLIRSAEYLRDELRDLGKLADTLKLTGTDRDNAATALKNIETAQNAMGSFTRTTTIGKAQAQLAAANSCLEKLRSAIKPVQVAAEKLVRFGECLVLQLLQETLAMGKHHGGVIGCPMALDQWGAVRDRFHQRYCSPVQVLTMGGERILLRSDQALALHITAGSQSGYAFDVSVHLWQRMDDQKNEPFDTSSTELFPPMNTQVWFDTFITCAVLHVPLP